MTSPLDEAAAIASWLAATNIDVLELTGPEGHLRLRRGVNQALSPSAAGGGRVGLARQARSDAGAVPTERRLAAHPTLLSREGEGGDPGEDVVTSTSFGLFLHAHPLRETPLIRPGDRVAAGQVLGLLKIGVLLLPVLAPREGIVRAVLAPEGSLVGFGDPLLALSSQG